MRRYAMSPRYSLLAPCLSAPVAFVLAACGSSDGQSRPAPPTLPAAVTTAGAGATAELDDERLVAVRTLPAAALSSENLEPAGTARGTAGEEIAMARANATEDAAPWELISADDEGWRVWRPASVLDALDAAGDRAALQSAEQVDWPDSCLGLAPPGQICAAVITPGYRVVIDVGGQTITYRTSATGRVEREP